ncbi:class B sortase [Helcococcus bovis]|uniref:class B sortase n=2 Tax=Helcococcus bovis TaxID=3153252 RepID=UPI0038B74A21
MKKTKKVFLTLIQIILVAIIIYSAYEIGTYYYQNYKSTKKLNEVSEEVTKIEKEIDFDNKGKELSKAEKDKLAKKIIADLQKRNKDIKAFIKAKDFKVNFPATYLFEDNETYLFSDLDGNWSRPGTLMVNGYNNPDFSDMNTTIFGHNLRTNPEMYAPMFKLLLTLEKKDFVNSKDDFIVEVYTEQGYHKYKIFTAYYSDTSDYYIQANRNKDEWVDYLNKVKNKSINKFKYEPKFTENSKILTLSTCDNDTLEGRFVVHALKVE